MQVKDVMSEPVTIEKSERIAYALDVMEKNGLRRLLVTSSGKLGGVITMRQIARVLGARQKLGLPASSLHVTTATLDAVIKVRPDMDLEDAALLLQKTSALVVMDGDDIVGWVRANDLLSAVTLEGVASDAMNVPLKVSPMDRLIHARRMMLDRDVGRLPVVERGKLVGILTEEDVAKALRAFRDLVPSRKQEARIKNLLVTDVMSTDLNTAYVDTPLEEIRQMILKDERGAIPILNHNEDLVGIITRTSLIDNLVTSG